MSVSTGFILLGDFKIRLDFKFEQELTYTSLADPKVTETVNIAVT
jgi:hypothetical protein